MNEFERVKQAYDILDYAKELTHMKRSGKSSKGLCPIHSETTPSFTVDTVKQLFYCHGCREGGDIFKLFELVENVGTYEALETLAERKGIVLADPDEGYIRRKEFQKKQSSIVERATEHMQKKEASEYMAQRGFTQETIIKFKIGYGAKNHSIIIPLTDHRGLVVGYCERYIGNPPQGYTSKYRLPSENPESDYYNELFKKTEFLFNEDNSRKALKKETYLLVFEGQFDAISADQVGFNASVACMQSSLSKEQAQRIVKLADDDTVIVLVPDKNKVGIESIQKNYELLKSINAKLIIKVMLLPEELKDGKEKDFNDFVVGGMNREQAESYIEYGEIGLLQVMMMKTKDFSLQQEYTRDIVSGVNNIFVKDRICQYLSDQWKVPVEKVSSFLEVKVQSELYERFKTIDDMKDDFLGMIFNQEQNHLKTGYSELDKVINSGLGTPTGWVIVYLARSSVGKTAFALNMINHCIEIHKVGATLFSFEQQGSDLYPKLVSIHEEVTQKKVIFDSANFGVDKYHEKMKNYQNNLLVWDYSKLKINEIEDLIRIADQRYFEDNPSKLILVDYLGYIKTEGKSRYEELASLTAEIKQVAKRTKKVFVILAQVGRGEKNDGSKPVQFSDARDSGTIEENADILLGAYRPDLEQKLESRELITVMDDYHIQVLKNRNGPTGKDATLRFDKPKQIIREWREGEKNELIDKLIKKCTNLVTEEERIDFVREGEY